METIEMIVYLSVVLLSGVVLVVIFSGANKGLGVVIGVLIILCAFVGMYYTGKLYYELKIPNIQEQVQEYNIQVAEQKLLELKGGNKE